MVEGIMLARLKKREADAIDQALRDYPQTDINELAVLYSTTYSTI
jgi:hypothetical protein